MNSEIIVLRILEVKFEGQITSHLRERRGRHCIRISLFTYSATFEAVNQTTIVSKFKIRTPTITNIL